MKDKLYQHIEKIFKHFYSFVMWIIYKYKTIVACRGLEKVSPEYKKDIRTYWKKYYRIKDTSNFKWYKAKGNLTNVKLIPDTVFHSKIEPFFSDLKSIDAFSNKCYYSLLFQGFKTPYTVAKYINGMYMDDNFKILSFDEVTKLCREEDEIIIKPALDSGGGRNITFLKMREKNADRELEKILEKYNKDFVIQRVVIQHEELQNMNPTSLNTVRIQSFLYHGKVHILSAFLRVGLAGARVDNLCKGGISIAMKENGDFHSIAYDGNGNKFYQHPNGYKFNGNKMPAYDKIIKSVKKLHPRFANYGIIGWDIAVDESGEPVFIEFNLIDTCIQAPQLSNGPFFKELTDEVLDEVFGKKKTPGKEKSKVLVAATVGLKLYGVTNSIMNYYRLMDKYDLQIDFVTTNKVPKRLKDEINQNGGKVYELTMRKYNPLKYLIQLARIMKREKYDIVHAHGNSATLAIELKVAKMCGVKVRISHCHNCTCDHMLYHKLLKPLFDHNYTHAFACSEVAGKWLYGEKPFTVINNAIPITNFFYNKKERKKYRKILGFENKKVIGHIGHFSYQKNHEFLIKIFSELYRQDNSYRLLLIGDGDLRDKLIKQVVDLGLNDAVCFYGETLKVPKLLQAMDLFVFPSRFEGLGMAVIEAQAAGLPCIVSDVVPLEAKITPQFELLSLNVSLDTWVKKILEFSRLDRENYSEQIKDNLLDSNYNIQTEAGKLKNLYDNFVEK